MNDDKQQQPSPSCATQHSFPRKVKIDDGTFFGGQDLVEWLCSRLKQELAFSAEIRKELEAGRLASSREFDR